MPVPRRLAAAALAMAMLAAAGCGADDGGSARPPTSVRISPLTPRDADRVTAENAAAIEQLAASGAGTPSDGAGHTHGAPSIEFPLLTGDAGEFANQWLAAERSTAALDTLEEISALGYVRASAPIPGIGAHWVRWSQLIEPFDPAHPAMLLFDESLDPPTLVGYSYALQSPTTPRGFAGDNDHWHQHAGLCIVNGWLDRERAAGPDQCAGAYVAGGDVWMLHAWVAPGYENPLGKFATVNRLLCPPNVGTPDMLRCPSGATGSGGRLD